MRLSPASFLLCIVLVPLLCFAVIGCEQEAPKDTGANYKTSTGEPGAPGDPSPNKDEGDKGDKGNKEDKEDKEDKGDKGDKEEAKANSETPANAAPTEFQIKYPTADCGKPSECKALCEKCTDDECSADAAAACSQVGRLALRGRSVDLVRAARSFEKACDGGHAVACSRLGLQVQDGRGVEKDVERAVQLYDRSCESGAGIGCFNLGTMYLYANGVEHDPDKANKLFKKALPLYKKACNAGELGWCLNLGVLYEMGFVEGGKQLEKSLEIYRKACDAGHGDSCVNFGLQLVNGEGIEVDLEGGISSIEKSCYELGSPLGCGTIGQLLVTGQHGVTKAPGRGVTILEGACVGGARNACQILGAVLAMGEGVEKDLQKALQYSRRACQLGMASSCMSLAYQYLPGKDVAEPDMEKAAHYFRQACQIGDSEGCLRIAAMTLLGRGVDEDEKKAEGYFTDACRLGELDGCLELINRDMELPMSDTEKKRFYTVTCQRGLVESCEKLPEGERPAPLQAAPASPAASGNQNGGSGGNGDTVPKPPPTSPNTP